MKIAILNANDVEGGAAIAAFRLNEGLNSIGLTSRMFVQKKRSDDFRVITEKNKFKNYSKQIINKIDKLPLTFYKGGNKDWHPSLLPSQKRKFITGFDPDLIHIHWTCEGFISIDEIGKFTKPVIWTMHDMWPFTGGCNYSNGCEQFVKGCGSCPQLISSSDNDLSAKVISRKNKSWNPDKITLVAPSNWLADEARKSYLFNKFDIRVIPNGINTTIFKPINRNEARNILNIDISKKIILFGAVNATSDKRKGFNLLKKSLDSLKSHYSSNDIELLVFGSSEPETKEIDNYKIHYLGSLKDQLSLSIAYSAADIFVAPSLEDNLPNTVIESMACGTPVIAYNIGGMSDMIDNNVNGFLVKAFDTKEYADKISVLLNDENKIVEFSSNARNKVIKNFDLKHVSKMYHELYLEKCER